MNPPLGCNDGLTNNLQEASKISQDIGPIEIHKIISKLDPFLKPIDICLHWQDYVKEKNIYERLGYNVFTAGGIFSDKFLPNF